MSIVDCFLDDPDDRTIMVLGLIHMDTKQLG